MLVTCTLLFCVFVFLDQRFRLFASGRKPTPGRALVEGLAGTALMIAMGAGFIAFEFHSQNGHDFIEFTSAMFIASAAEQLVIMGQRMRKDIQADDAQPGIAR